MYFALLRFPGKKRACAGTVQELAQSAPLVVFTWES